MKKLGLLTMPLMAISILASCGKTPSSKPEEYDVTCTSGVTVANLTAIQGKKYETKLTTEGGTILPEQAKKVTINEETSTNYTYDKVNDTEATFVVEAQYVTGPISIELDLIHGYVVTVTEGVTLKKGTEVALPNEKYETTLTVEEGIFLPASPTEVTISEAASTDYTYTKNSNTEATFVVEAQYVTGPINIKLKLGPYTASVDSLGGEKIELSNTVVNPLKDYETVVSFSDVTYHTKNFNGLMSVVINGKWIRSYTFTVNSLKRNEATLKIDKSLLTGDVVITTIKLKEKTKWYEFSDWWNYCSPSETNAIPAATENEIGQIVGVEINDLMHEVRLIDVDHTGADGETPEAHCTFEFANLITDSNRAVTTGWDSVRSLTFTSSVLHNLLNKTEMDDCIFNKLPEGLQKAIKEVNKKVYEGEDYVTPVPWSIKTYPAKLFPLAYDEMVGSGDYDENKEGCTYKYYIGHDSDSVEDLAYRIKKDINGDAVDYWFRSPYLNGGSNTARQVTFVGAFTYKPVSTGLTIAPAFCI